MVRGVVSALVAAVLLVTTFTDTTDLEELLLLMACRQGVTRGKGGPLTQFRHGDTGVLHSLKRTQRLLEPGKKVNSVQLPRWKQAAWHSSGPAISVSSIMILSSLRLQYCRLNTSHPAP